MVVVVVVVVVVGKCIDHDLLLWLLSVGFVIVEDNQLGLSIYEVEWLTLVDFEE